MEKLTIKLDNGFEFDADPINETHNIIDKTKFISINAPLDSVDISAVEKNITVENMRHFVAVADDKEVYEFTGYTDNIVIHKIIGKHGMFMTLNAQKNKTENK